MSNPKGDPSKRTLAYVEEVIRLIEEKPDVMEIMILNNKGNPIKSTMEKTVAIQCAGVYEILRSKVCLALQKIDPHDELVMLRLRTTKHEALIVPDGKITVIVLQNAKDRFQNF